MSTPTAQFDDAQVLLRQDRDGVTTLTLNRPAQYNCLSEALLDDLQATLDAIAADRSVRVVVIAGAGRAFCAGHDLHEMRANPRHEYYQDLFTRCSRMMQTIAALPQPVIARVHGVAAAGGCQLVAACDLAVASDAARFAVPGVKLGLFCSTPAVPLARNVSRKRAFEMLVTGDLIDAATAADYGLVNHAVAADALDTEIERLCQSILAKTPVAVEMGKRAFYRQVDLGLGAAYELATDTMACNLMTEDAAEGIDAFIDKREPVWKGC